MEDKKEKKRKHSKIFTKYFLLFVSLFLAGFLVLGIVLISFVNAYSIDEKTELLKENSSAVAKSVSSMLPVKDMNSSFSLEKQIICEQLLTISNCIDSDVFICDVGGNVIMCKERSGSDAYNDNSMVCEKHRNYHVDDTLMQNVLENGTAVTKANVNGVSSYVVGTSILVSDYSGSANSSKKGKSVTGLVFATVKEGTTELVSRIIRTFVIIFIVATAAASLVIWLLTKRMVTPLQQMSEAAKRFSVGDFSYRVKIDSHDELADLGNAFNDMAQALDKLEGSRRSFVANISHELKTPMTSIAGFIDGILDGTIPKEKQDYYLKIVSDEVKRLSRLVVAMLNMSKMESGEFEMKPKNYDISDQIIHILLTFEQKIDRKNIEIRGLGSLGKKLVYADPDMIYQVIYNLFDNAVKFTNENGYIAAGIKEADDDMYEISVKNSGSGIAESEIPRIFERFYKVDKSRSLDSKGSGLGLYIVKIIVEMNGGKITARSDGKTQTEFIFTLPKSK